MADIQETRLPGVGMRYDFVTAAGRRVGVLAHLSGRRELLVYDDRDPDACRSTVELDEEDARVLTELLGADHIAEQLGDLRQQISGMAIDWLPVEAPRAGAAPRRLDAGTVGEAGVSVVAVIRSDEAVPAPARDFELRSGDTVVVVGTPEGIRRAHVTLHGA